MAYSLGSWDTFSTGGSGTAPTQPSYQVAGSGGGMPQLASPPAGASSTDLGKFNVDLQDWAGTAAATAAGIGGVATQVTNSLHSIPGVGAGLDVAFNAVTTAADVLSTPERILETQVARERLAAAQEHRAVNPLAKLPAELFNAPSTLIKIAQGQASPGAGTIEKGISTIPPDIMQRLQNGENIDVLAGELAKRNAGFTSDAGTNLTSSFLLDPMNLVYFGAGPALKAASGARYAYDALATGDKLTTAQRALALDTLAKAGLPQRALGYTVSAATRGLSTAGAAFTGAFLGDVTQGAVRSLGTGTVNRVYKLFDGDPAVQDALMRGLGNTNANTGMEIIAQRLTKTAQEFPDVAPKDWAAVQAAIQHDYQVLRDSPRRWDRQRLQRDIANFYDRVKPDIPPDQIKAFTDSRVAAIRNITPEEASAWLASRGWKYDRASAQTLDGMVAGMAYSDLAERIPALVALPPEKLAGLDPLRLTGLGPRTLTEDVRVKALAQLADKTTKKQAVLDELSHYQPFYDRFGDRAPNVAEVKKWLEGLAGGVPQEVHLPTTGANPLPAALQEWRQRWESLGYKIGFKSENPVRVVADENGKPIFVKGVWADYQTGNTPAAIPNALSRFTDTLFRGISQGTIIQTARQTFSDNLRASRNGVPGLSPRMSRSIFGELLHRAGESRVVKSPRGYAVLNHMDDIFLKFMTPTQYKAWRAAGNDPVFEVLRAFSGHWDQVGLTQAFTGQLKTLPFIGQGITAMAEVVWPMVRFKWNPIFQAQEKIESYVLNAMRGVNPWKAHDEKVAALYEQNAILKVHATQLWEGWGIADIRGNDAINQVIAQGSGLRGALDKGFGIWFGNIQQSKRNQMVKQIAAEWGPQWKEAMRALNPGAYLEWEKAAGSTVPADVMNYFLAERGKLISGQAAAVVDAAKPGGTGWLMGSADMETGWIGLRQALLESEKMAARTHYFEVERNLVNRTINHVVFGIYPASYMWGKMVPEFLRFMLKRPFGLNAPLLGYAATHRLQQALVSEQATNPEFANFVKQFAPATYVISLLLPAGPLGTDLPANVAAPVRHLVGKAVTGQPITGRTVQNEISSYIAYQVGAYRASSLTVDFVDQINGMLDAAANLYDSNPAP